MPTSDYEIPPYAVTPSARLHGWLLEAVQEGNAWLQTQKQAANWSDIIPLLDGLDPLRVPDGMSNTQYPLEKRIARELVASLAGFHHEGEIAPLWDNDLFDQAHILTQIDRHWYESTKANAQHRAGLQYAVGLGTGYWLQEWDANFWGPGRGDIRLTAFSPSDITFVQLPKDHDLQRAYAVIIRYEMPINLARRTYGWNPAFAASLVPDRDSPNWIQKGLRKVQQFVSPALRVAGRSRPGNDSDASFPTVDIFHTYIMDGAINETFAPITMGPRGTNWTYQVPAHGGEIPTGMMNPATGVEWTRPATREDCLMFPLRRLSIFSSTGVCYDGSSPWWHGDVPVAAVRYSDWPWNALGSSTIADIRSMTSGISALMREMEDSAAARLDPPAVYNDTLVSKSWAEAFNPRRAGVRGAADTAMGSPITFPVPPEQYNVPAWIPEYMNRNEDRARYMTGVQDLTAIAKARQIPGADTLEKLLEMAGPLVQDMVRAVELPLTQLGNWRKAYYFQFYTASRVIQLVGPDDFDPKQWRMFGPDKIADIKARGSFQFDQSQLLGPLQGVSAAAKTDLAKRRVGDFVYNVTESGVSEINRMTTKLFYLQLMKEGFPISWWTFAKIARIPNFGPAPDGTNNEMERWIAQQHIQIELQAELQIEAQQAMMAAQLAAGGTPDAAMMGAGGESPDGNGGGPPMPGQTRPQGRPQSYKNPPKMVQKDHGTRTTISTA